VFLIDDILKAIKTDTDATRLRILENDVRTAVYAAEQVIGSGRGEDKLSYALEYLTTEKGYDPDKDMLRELIEATVYQMQKDRPQRSRKAKAETAQEFKDKYGRKRFNGSNAGRALIYSYIYWGYLKNEGMSNEEIVENPLYKNLSHIRDKVQTVQDARQYYVYVNLQEWLANAFEHAVIMRNATRGAVSHFYTIVADTIAGENLRETIGESASSDKVALWLSALSVDCIRPTKNAFSTAQSLRINIDKGLRYLNVFNTLISMIAEETEIPELEIFKVQTAEMIDGIERLNEALEVLREEIARREVVPDGEAEASLSPAFTPKEMEATLEAFSEVSKDAPAIPADNVKYTQRQLSGFVMSGTKAWTNLFSTLSRDYWRR